MARFTEVDRLLQKKMSNSQCAFTAFADVATAATYNISGGLLHVAKYQAAARILIHIEQSKEASVLLYQKTSVDKWGWGV